jgi:hypothetical protein
LLLTIVPAAPQYWDRGSFTIPPRNIVYLLKDAIYNTYSTPLTQRAKQFGQEADLTKGSI